MHDLLVLGSGVAGLSAALRAERAGQSVTVVTKGELRDSATWYAQGGVAAALEEPDSPELHFADTLAAGAGLCDQDAVRVLVNEGPERVLELIDLGAVFDRSGGVIALAREGGHSLARVLHAGGDATGAEIERALVAAVRSRPIELHEHTFTTDLVVENGHCVGVRMLNGGTESIEVRARNTILATGGAGQVFGVTTNPVVSTGDGVAMAWRAGAAIADVEFMQFHPTALHHPQMPRPLLSEALRGEGAVLRDTDGLTFMDGEHPLGDLAPRDVVARAITRRMRERHLEHLWLDATTVGDFERRFPTIWQACRAVGLDPHRDWLPVAPAAHYLSGGVMADLDGASLLPGLWAIGEVSCSGVHGANRLASNSLLDGLVFAPRAVEAILAGKREPDATGVLRGVVGAFAVEAPFELPLSTRPTASSASGLRAALQRDMSLDAGVLRDEASLEHAAELCGTVAEAAERLASHDVSAREVVNLATVAGLLVDEALAREESRGTHTRLDFPEADDAFLGRFVRVGDRVPAFVPLPPEHLARVDSRSGERVG